MEAMRFPAFLLGLLAIPALAASVQPYNIPLRFEPNVGQAPQFALFSARTKGFSVLAGQSGLRFIDAVGNAVEMRFHGAQTPSSITGDDRQSSFSNYFIGSNPAGWKRNVPNFGSVMYRDLYPGIHLKLHPQQGSQLEYDFLVDAGANPSSVQLEFSGSSKLEISKSGDLLIHTKSGVIRHQKPTLYQDGKRIDGHFVKKSPTRIGFFARNYDPMKKLVIDPIVIFSTYLGGNRDDQINAMAIGPDGSVLVTGTMKSTNFPRRLGLTNSTDAGGSFDTFVVKLNSSGTGIEFTTVIGGNRDDIAQAIALDSSGNIYVAGTTNSTDLPVSATAYQKTNSGGFSNDNGLFRGDAFLFKLDPTGATILFATYLGGSLGETVTSLLLDKDQNPVITGSTLSGNFPITANAYQRAAGGNGDGFISKFNATGSDLVYSSYLGGSGVDTVSAIAQDKNGNFYVTGATSSPNFPISTNAPQKVLKGNNDIFATKFSATWALVYSTLYGGSGSDVGTSIAVDANGLAWITGTTTNSSFPIIAVSALQDTYSGGNTDGVFFSLNDTGSTVRFASFFGGNRQEENPKIIFHPDGSLLIAATTDSTNFPATRDAIFFRNSGARDILLIKIPADVSALTFSTYFGGSNNDLLNAIAVDPAGNIFLAGTTDSQFFPSTNGSFQPITLGGTDGFIVKLGAELPNLLNTEIVPIKGVVGGPPAFSDMTLTSSGAPLEFRISYSSPGSWLSANPVVGITPATIRLTADPGSLISGNYTGRLTIATSGTPLNSIILNIPLVISSPVIGTVGPQISAAGILNGASFKSGSIAPGEVITIYGSGIGPVDLLGAQLTSAGTVSKFIGATRVLFDGIAAPLLYVSANQTSAIAPYFLSNRETSKLEVEYIGIRSNAVTVTTVGSSPALFTLNASGSGFAAALNENGSVNTTDKPAKKGGVIVLYATGEGQTKPDGVDGQLAGSILPVPLLPVKVTIDGKDAVVLYAGGAPGIVAGAMQINVRIPPGTASGEVPVVLTVGDRPSPDGVTIAVE